MCDHHTDLPVEAVMPLPVQARPAALIPGRAAADFLGQVEASGSAPRVVEAASLPPVAPAVADAVHALMATVPAAPELAAEREVRVLVSSLNRGQRKTLERMQGTTLYLKGLGGNVQYKRDGSAVVLTLPAGSKHSESTVIAVFQNYLNR